jgi:HK97 family phage portal protein
MAWWNRREPQKTESKAVSPVSAARSGWWSIFESYAGAWQRNVEVNRDTVLSFHAVFACQSLIASDISKLPIFLYQKDGDGVWVEINNPAYSPVLRRPNRYQTTKQFIESWVISKLQDGNTYVLKERDNRNVVVRLHILDPRLVMPMVADDGSVFYQLSNDKLAGLENGQIMVPASEIIHDRFNCLFHPLVGMSPIYAAGLAATQGLSIQEDSTLFFKNGARPGGVLTADGAIQDDTAARLKAYWDENFTGSNAGKVAVLGDGLKYEQIRAKANDSQVIEQLKWSAEVVCGVYHVPPFMIGVGAEPTYDNVQTVTLRYYSQCLQVLIKDITDLLDEGLGMDGISIGCDFDTDELLRMDALTQMDVLEKSKGKLTVNEQRRKLNRGPVTGGDTVYLQEQDHSLEWLAKRDAMPIEPAAADPASAPPADNDNDSEIAAQANKAMIAILKGLR